jgi:peptidoglycan L-alanyl-D-glutamate endopeptidase CwlK
MAGNKEPLVIPGEAFFKKLVSVASSIGVPPEDMLLVMTNESGLNPAAHNANGNASGLIQFMPDTLKRMKFKGTHEDVRAMNAAQQLDLVAQFYRPYKGKLKNATDLYIATFLPVFLGKRDPGTVLARKDNPRIMWGDVTEARVYKDNKSLDFDKDGVITYGDMTSVVNARMGSREYLAAVDALNKYTEYKTDPSKYRGKPPAYQTNDGQFTWRGKYAKPPQEELTLKSETPTLGTGSASQLAQEAVKPITDPQKKTETQNFSDALPGAGPVIEIIKNIFDKSASQLARAEILKEAGADVQLSDRSKSKISELQPAEFQKQVEQMMLKGLSAGLRPEIVEGYRTQSRQDDLYEQGRSKPGAIVTQTRSSMHTRRMAVDIAQLDAKGNITYNAQPSDFWEKMGAIGRSVGLEWGGDWEKWKDKPHFQYAKANSIKVEPPAKPTKEPTVKSEELALVPGSAAPVSTQTSQTPDSQKKTETQDFSDALPGSAPVIDIIKNIFNKSSSQQARAEILKEAGIVKIAYIRKIPGNKWRVFSEKGRNMGTYNSESAAKKRLRQIEFFKHQNADDHNSAKDGKVINLTDIDAFTYSAIIRKLRELEVPTLKVFLRLFKIQFDQAVLAGDKHPDKTALKKSLIEYNQINKIKLPAGSIKTAALSDYGSPEQIGRTLADIVKFELYKFKPESRDKVLQNIKNKITNMNYIEMSGRKMPVSATIGQIITFIKTALLGQPPQLIRRVMLSILQNLGAQ